MASKSKSASIKIKLVSSAGTGYYYTTTLNKKNRQMKQIQGKIILNKYDPKVRKHVPFKEEKISK